MAEHKVGIDATTITFDGEPFALQGLSFFNAVYNGAFGADRDTWLRKFLDNGVNTLRVWCQWNFEPPHSFVDVEEDHTLYTPEGDVRDEWWGPLAETLTAADRLGMVVEVTLFSNERQDKLPRPAMERAAREMTRRLGPHTNTIIQIWNECSLEWRAALDAVRSVGGYHIYHHDMFQNQNPDRTPPSGIPDPDFRSFHREVFDYLRSHRMW